MSHEWNCVCVRCERERDWLDAVDEELEAKRAFTEGETAYDPRLPDAD